MLQDQDGIELELAHKLAIPGLAFSHDRMAASDISGRALAADMRDGRDIPTVSDPARSEGAEGISRHETEGLKTNRGTNQEARVREGGESRTGRRPEPAPSPYGQRKRYSTRPRWMSHHDWAACQAEQALDDMERIA